MVAPSCRDIAVAMLSAVFNQRREHFFPKRFSDFPNQANALLAQTPIFPEGALSSNPRSKSWIIRPGSRHVTIAMRALVLDQCRKHVFPISRNWIPDESNLLQSLDAFLCKPAAFLCHSL